MRLALFSRVPHWLVVGRGAGTTPSRVTMASRGSAGDGIRANAKRFHLTYAACFPGELTHAVMLLRMTEFASRHGGLKEWSIGRETHKEPADPERDERNRRHAHVVCAASHRAAAAARRPSRRRAMSITCMRTIVPSAHEM